MSTEPNRYRDLHRAVESLGNQCSGYGLHAEATSLWAIAARIKQAGLPSGADQADEPERQP